MGAHFDMKAKGRKFLFVFEGTYIKADPLSKKVALKPKEPCFGMLL